MAVALAGAGRPGQLELEASGPAQPVELALTVQRPGQGIGPITNVGRLFEPLGTGQGGHPRTEGVEEQRRIDGESVDHPAHEDAVVGLAHRSRAGARSHAQLGRAARPVSRHPAGALGAAANGHSRLDGVGHLAGDGVRRQRAHRSWPILRRSSPEK